MTDVIGGATTIAAALATRVGSDDRAVTFVEITLALNAVGFGFAESWRNALKHRCANFRSFVFNNAVLI